VVRGLRRCMRLDCVRVNAGSKFCVVGFEAKNGGGERRQKKVNGKKTRSRPRMEQIEVSPMWGKLGGEQGEASRQPKPVVRVNRLL